MAARDVQFVIRARDEASRQLDSIVNALQELAAAQAGIKGSSSGANRDLAALVATLAGFDKVAQSVGSSADMAGEAFNRQRAKIAQLKAELKSVESQRIASVRALGEVRGAAAATGQDPDTAKMAGIEAAQAKLTKTKGGLIRQIEREESALASLASEYQKLASVANALENMAPQVIGAADQAQAAEAMRVTAAAAQELRDRLDPTLAIQRRLNSELGKVRDLHRAGAITAKEMAAAEQLLQHEAKQAADELNRVGRGEKGKVALFGLKPYELTNLGYQVNDVVTQLASGTGFMQVMAQQGGQLLQLFPRIGASITAALTNPAVLAFAATMGLIAVAIGESVGQAERLRTISGILRANADGARYSADKIVEAQVALDEFGLSAKEASDTVRLFIKEGLNPQYINEFGMAAKNMARVLGGDVADAAKQVVTAFTAGYDAIAQFDDAQNFLTAAEREHIRVLFESGKAAEARNEAFRIFERSMDAAADKSRSKWEKAVSHLDDAWGDLKRSLADTAAIEGVVGLLERLADVLDRIANLTGDVGSVSSLDSEMAAVEAKMKKLQDSIDRGRVFGSAKKELESQVAELFAELNVLAMRKAAMLEQQQARGDTTSGDSEAAKKARSDRLAELDLEKRTALAVSDAAKIKIAGERAYQAEIRKTGDIKTAEASRDQARFLESTRIQRERRQDLLSTARSFSGRREDNRGDNAALQALFAAAKIDIDPAKVAWCAAFINAILASKGLPTSGSQLASSFNKYGSETKNPEKGDIVVLKPQARGSSGHVGFFEGFAENGDVRVLGGNQGKFGSVNTSTFSRKDVVSFRRPGNIGEGFEGLGSEVEEAVKLAEQQSEYNRKIDEENANRQLAIKYLKEQLGLSVQDTFESGRRQVIEEAITNAERDAKEKNLALTAERKKQIQETIGAQYDLEHAEQLVNDRIQEQQELRDALIRGIEAAEERGDNDTVARLRAELDKTEPVINKAIDDAEKFWSQFNTPESKAALENLRQLRQEITDTGAQLLKAHIDQLGKQIEGGRDLRGVLQERVGVAQLLGDRGAAKDAQRQIEALDAHMIALRQSAIEAWEAIAGDPNKLAALGMTAEQVQALIVGLQNAQVESEMFGRRFLATGEQINLMLVDGMANAVDDFLGRIQNGESVIGALWRSLAGMAADFLRDIGMMILKQTLFNALTKNGTNVGGGVGGMIAGAMGSLFTSAAPLTAAGSMLTAAGGVLTSAGALWQGTAVQLMAAAQMLMAANAMSVGVGHTGGLAESLSGSRNVSPAVFAGARRYHRGGMAGLRPDEVPAILQRGEEVLTKGNPRHRNNLGRGGAGGGGLESLKVVGVFDPAEIPNAMASSKGERVIMTTLSRNKTALKQMLKS